MTEEMLFDRAIQLPTSERVAFLDRECLDPALKARVLALLAADATSHLPLDGPGDHTHTFGEPNRTGSHSTGPAAEEAEGAILAGKYKLVERIGEGGMGSVYMAQQTEPVKRAVAVKVIKAGMDSKAVLARFEAERQALAMMDHPNIARVLDAGTTAGGRPYFVMELVKGVPITQFCDERKLTPRQRLELFVPVCQAIQHAHQKGVIHRDIKPSNVLVALYDDRPVPKVIDFGVAKAAGQTLTDRTLMTGFGAVVGTPEYMSPEQASLNNLDIDTRSDVYSLGVLLYELLTGSTPVDRQSLGKAALLEILRIVREVEAPRPSAKLSTIDTLPSVAANRGTEPAKLSKLMKGELDWVLLKALEKDRTRRYDTANGLARDIQRYLADEVVEARPPSTSYRVKKFVKRHKGQMVAASLVLFALVAGVIGTTLGMIEAKRQTGIALAAEAAEAERAEGERLAKLTAEAKEREANDERDEVKKLKDRIADRLYTADMNRANALLDAGEVRRCKEVLARHQPTADQADARDRRNVEWHYLNWASNASARVIEADKDIVAWRAVSPDGALAIAEVAGGYRVWDVKAGKILSTLPVEKRRLGYAAFHPTERLVVTVDHHRAGPDALKSSIRVWPVREGAEKPDRVIDLTAPPNELTFSPDGKRLFVGLQKPLSVIRVFDTTTWEVVDTLTGLAEQPYALVVSRDGRTLASGLADLTVRLTPLGGQGPVRVIPGVTGVTRDVLFQPKGFSPDGTRLLTANWEAVFRVWDVSGPNPHPVNTRSWLVAAAKYSPSGDSIAVGTRDGLVRLVDPNTLEEKLLLRGHTATIAQLAFDPTGRWLTTCALDKTIRVWDLASPGGYRLLDGHREGVLAVALSPDGKTAVGAGENNDGGIRVWDADSGAKKAVLAGHPGGGRKVRFSPDGKTLASCGNDGLVKLWDATTWADKPVWEAEVLPRAVVRVTSIGALAAATGVAPTLDEFAHRPYWIGVSDVRFSADGTRLICCTWSPPMAPVSQGPPKVVRPKVQILDAKTGRTVKEWVFESGHGLYEVAFSPDASRVVARVWHRDWHPESVVVWDITADKPKELFHLRPPGTPSGELHLSIAVHPNGKELAVGSREDKAVRFYDLATGKELDKRLSGPAVGQVTYTDDGSRVITAADHIANVWDAASGDELLCLRGHTGLVTGIAVTPTADRIATSSLDRTVRIWDALRGR